MSRWFRFYDDTINDPKILKLSDKLHRFWVGILCVASKNGGQLPSRDDIALLMRTKVEKSDDAIESLIEMGLIDTDGVMLSPHNWNGRQYKSDVSNERVKRFRERKRNVTSTVTVTPPESETDNRTDSPRVSRVTANGASEEFEEFKKTYPRRDGSNPWPPARKIFDAALKKGATAKDIIAGAAVFATKERANVGTPYIPQAVKWLRNEGWKEQDSPALNFKSNDISGYLS